MRKIITFIILMLIFNMNVNAASLCSYKEQTEINSKVANVKLTYEVKSNIKQNEEGIISGDIYFDVMILNVTEDFYVKIKNDYNKEELTFTNANALNDLITFKWNYMDTLTNFTVEVYTTSKTSCPNERYKTIYLTTPRYNEFANREICEGHEELNLCQEFVTFSKMNDSDFINKIIEYENTIDNNKEPSKDLIKQENPTLMDNVFEFINEYKFYLLGGLVLIVSVVVIIQRKRTKKQRELGL